MGSHLTPLYEVSEPSRSLSDGRAPGTDSLPRMTMLAFGRGHRQRGFEQFGVQGLLFGKPPAPLALFSLYRYILTLRSHRASPLSRRAPMWSVSAASGANRTQGTDEEPTLLVAVPPLGLGVILPLRWDPHFHRGKQSCPELTSS